MQDVSSSRRFVQVDRSSAAFGLLICRVRRRALLIGGIAGALLLKFAVYQTFGNVDANSAAWRVIISYQEAILWGVLLAFALNHRAIYEACAKALRSGWTVLGLGAVATVWLMTHPMESQSTWDAELLNVLMTAILAGVVMHPGVPFLSGSLMSHIGRISYGIYLLHMFVLSAVRKLPAGPNPWVYIVIGTVSVIAVASVVHRWFEEPIIRFYKRRLSATPPNSVNELATATPSSAAPTPHVEPLPASVPLAKMSALGSNEPSAASRDMSRNTWIPKFACSPLREERDKTVSTAQVPALPRRATLKPPSSEFR